MKAVRSFAWRLTAFLHFRRDEDRLKEEIESHLAMQAADNLRAGLPPAEARRQAVLKFGPPEAAKEDCRDQMRLPLLETLARDIRHALRRLKNSPAFTVATILTLALGIGANTAIFSVIDGVLLKALPYPAPDRLVAVWQTAPGVNIKDLNPSLADYLTYRDESRTFAGVALWDARAVTVTEFADPERVEGFQATFRLLPLLGVRPAYGRGLTEKDDENSSPQVMLIGYGYWQRRFGGDPNVIGRRIMADGAKREIVGILPRDFWFLDQPHDIVLPLQFDRSAVTLGGYNHEGIARLRPGVTLTQANADVARMIDIEMARFPAPGGLSKQMMKAARLAPNLRPLKDDLVGDIGKTLWVVMATVGIVLLIACANVANLLLVRNEGRTQELTVRAALGASRARLARETVVESLILALMGGVAAIGFAVAVVKLVLKMSPARLPRFEQISVDSIALLFTLGISIAAGLLFAAIPVWKHGGAGIAESLRAGGRTASAGRERNFARNALTVVQAALALVLLIGSGLMVRTFQSMRHVDPGFSHPEALETLSVSIPRNAIPGKDDLLLMQRNLTERLAALPGVMDASLIEGLPMTGFLSQDPIFAEDHTYAPGQIPTLRRFVAAGPAALRALGARLVAGTGFTWTDMEEKRGIAIVSENFAREYWGSPQAAIGKRIRSGSDEPWSEVIGVAGDIRLDGVEKKAPATVYWPLSPKRNSSTMTFLVRSSRAGTESLASEIRRAVWSVNASLPITKMQTMQSVCEKSMSRTAFTLALLGISGGMALLLAVIGIYAVIAYAVAQRAREIGIRMALGARQGKLKLMFVRNGVLWAGIGAAVGLFAAVALSRLISTLLFEINPVDPLTYSLVAMGLLVSAALASYLPARRVTRVDPMEALRAE